jgi:hypothetical protein
MPKWEVEVCLPFYHEGKSELLYLKYIIQRCCFFCAIIIVSCAVTTFGKEPNKEQLAFFEAKIRPLFIKHCFECHSTEAGKSSGGLLLDSKEGWSAGGDSGEVIEVGKPDESLLLESVRYSNPKLRMPPKYQLSEREIEDLEKWIEIGAPDPRASQVARKSYAIDWEKGKKHWAFQPISKPVVPQVQDTQWVRDDLDRFILAKIEAAGITPVEDVDRFALIRRVSLDLTGLPPTVDEVGEFVKDPAGLDEALEKVVDRLLKSPAFGERWGRHWLDVARYADSVGKTRNIPFAFAWRYRNYVIDSFNADKPFNKFAAEQIAGDLLDAQGPKDRAENYIATGFLALGSMDLNERDQEQFTLDRIDDQIDTLGRAFLGMTLGCARCHDHKFDPISQADYYALAGVFASSETLSGQQGRSNGTKTYVSQDRLVKIDLSSLSDSKKDSRDTINRATQISELQMKLKQMVAEGKIGSLSPAQLKVHRQKIGALRKKLNELKANESTNSNGSKKVKSSAEEGVDPTAQLAMAVTEGRAKDIPLRVRGEPDIKGDVIQRALPTIVRTAKYSTIGDNQNSGRLELARWVSSSENPLTARVMVNRVWLHLLGRGLVESVDNFGASGSAPTHPELLDFLSKRFMEENWSIKSLVRSIVLSHTYRLSSVPIEKNSEVDEGNQLYWRANLRRLEVEAIRDSLLAAGDMLILKRPSGAPFDASFQGDISRVNRNKKGAIDPVMEPIRSVYLPIFRSKLPGMYTAFDFAEPDQVNGLRDVTTVAPQALFMLNNPFVIQAAERAAKRILEQDLQTDEVRIRFAYAYTLSRYPTKAETERALAFLGDGSDRESRWVVFAQSLYASAEFRYVP